MSRETFHVVLEETKHITPTIRHLVFTRKDAGPMAFIPGQFMTFYFDHQGTRVKRSYSIATCDDKPEACNYLEIAVAYVDSGKASDYFFNAQLGLVAEVSGPLGQLIIPPALPKRLVLVATGTGVAPYRSMLPQLASKMAVEGMEVDLLLGVREPEDLLYGEDFTAFAEQQQNFTFHACFSRVLPKNPKTYEYQGRVLERMKYLNLTPDNDLVYLCGNPAMVDDAYAFLKSIDFGMRQVKREKYVFSKK